MVIYLQNYQIIKDKLRKLFSKGEPRENIVNGSKDRISAWNQKSGAVLLEWKKKQKNSKNAKR